MTGDILEGVGVLGLGSRLKRLSDRILSDGAKVFAAAGYDFQPSMFPMIVCLDRYGEVGVVEAARRIGVSQPAVTRVLNMLEERGLVEQSIADTDSRQKVIRLSASGKHILSKMKSEIWPAVQAAVEEACPEKGTVLLAHIKQLEAALEETSLFDRIMEKVDEKREHIHS